MDAVVVDGDRFASRTTVTGTHSGELKGIHATGVRIEVGAVDIARIENGRGAERWGGLDTFSLMVQLGAIPAPQPA